MRCPGSLSDVLEEKLYELSSSLPRLMRDPSNGYSLSLSPSLSPSLPPSLPSSLPPSSPSLSSSYYCKVCVQVHVHCVKIHVNFIFFISFRRRKETRVSQALARISQISQVTRQSRDMLFGSHDQTPSGASTSKKKQKQILKLIVILFILVNSA